MNLRLVKIVPESYSRFNPKIFRNSVKKRTYENLVDEYDPFTIEDGINWIKNFLDINGESWLSLFTFLPKNNIDEKNKKSAVLALFQASLDQANQGEIEINQNSHFEKIMVRSRNG